MSEKKKQTDLNPKITNPDANQKAGYGGRDIPATKPMKGASEEE